MSEYHPLNIQSYNSKNKTSTVLTHKIKYKLCAQGKEGSKINAVEFTHNSPYLCAITSGTKVIFYDVEKKEPSYQFTAIKNIANFATFRQDDKLVGIGDDTGLLQIVDSSSRTILRRLKEHQGPVRSAHFLHDKTHIISGGDDRLLKLWDISEGKCVNTFSTHTDKIRRVVSSGVGNSSYLCLSGSYDGYLKLWDIRTHHKEVLMFSHGAPIEDIAIYPKSLMCVSVGGNQVKIWDLTTGTMIDNISNHSKTITSVCVTNDESKLITSSLDNTVKWIDVCTKNVLKTHYFDHQVFTTALSPLNEFLAAGLGEGTWTIRYRDSPSSVPSLPSSSSSVPLTRPSHTHKHTTPSSFKTIQTMSDLSSKSKSPLEKLLRNFKYKEALDLALTLSSAHVISLIEELIQRGALYIALGGRDEITILPFLKFISRNIGTDSPHTSIILEALHTLLEENDWMGKTLDSTLYDMLKGISQVIGYELAQHYQLEEIQGILDMVLIN